MADVLKKIFLLGILILIIGVLIGCEEQENPEDVKKEYMTKVNDEIADSTIKNFLKGDIKLLNVERDRRESLTFYNFFLEAELSNDFNSLIDEEKYALLKELDYIDLDRKFSVKDSNCAVETLTFISGSDEYRVEPLNIFAIYKNDKVFDLEPKETYIPSSGNSDKPTDYNSDGEYKPVEDMTQEEIQAELEEILRNSLGQ